MILVDTSIWIDYFNGTDSPKTEWLDRALGIEPIIVGDVILAEILQGFRQDHAFNTAKKMLLLFPIVELVGKEIAIKSAANYRMLRKKGVTVRKTIDVVIGTYCIETKTRLLHNDSDFHPLETYLAMPTVKILSTTL